jgi:ABC-type lipoprotein export system ATPase subunit
MIIQILGPSGAGKTHLMMVIHEFDIDVRDRSQK